MDRSSKSIALAQCGYCQSPLLDRAGSTEMILPYLKDLV